MKTSTKTKKATARPLNLLIPESHHQLLEKMRNSDPPFTLTKTAVVLRGIKLVAKEVEKRKKFTNGHNE